MEEVMKYMSANRFRQVFGVTKRKSPHIISFIKGHPVLENIEHQIPLQMNLDIALQTIRVQAVNPKSGSYI